MVSTWRPFAQMGTVALDSRGIVTVLLIIDTLPLDPLQIIVAHSGQIHLVAVRPLSITRWIGRGSPP
jgi:hypothetical protein